MSRKDSELKVLLRRPESNSDSEESSDLRDSPIRSTAQTQTEFSEEESEGFPNPLLNTSDENHNALDMDRASLGSQEDASSVKLIRTRHGSSKRQKKLLAQKAKRLKSSSTRSASLLDTQEGCSTSNACLPNSSDGPLTRSDSSSNPPERPSTANDSTDPLEGPSSRTVFSDSGEGSVMNVCQASGSETEINGLANSGSLAELNGFWQRVKAWLGNFLIRNTRQIRNSAYFPLLQLALLAITYLSGYMGLQYRYLCPGCAGLPIMMYVYSVLGMFIIILRIAAVLSRRYFAPMLTGRELRNFMTFLCIFYFFFHAIAMAATSTCEPNFIHPGSKDFCIKIFYDYAYAENIVAVLVVFLMCLVHIPALYDPSEVEDFNF